MHINAHTLSTCVTQVDLDLNTITKPIKKNNEVVFTIVYVQPTILSTIEVRIYKVTKPWQIYRCRSELNRSKPAYKPAQQTLGSLRCAILIHGLHTWPSRLHRLLGRATISLQILYSYLCGFCEIPWLVDGEVCDKCHCS